VDRLALILDWIEYYSDEGTNLPRMRDLSNEYREAYSAYESTSAATANYFPTHNKRPLEVDPHLEPPAKVARTSRMAVPEYTGYENVTNQAEYYYPNYYEYDYSAYNYQGYDPTNAPSYDPSSGSTF